MLPCTLYALTVVLSLAAEEPAKTRSFLFSYSATITGLEPGTKARIWLPYPPSNQDQDVSVESKDLPGKEKIGKETKYGNEILYVEGTANKDGDIPLTIVYRVTRREVHGETAKNEKTDLAKFLKPDAKVPIDGKPLELLKDRKLPADQVEAARAIYDVVFGHMRYSKEGTGWGQGDSVWACESKYGNCTDFHSLFISLVRSQKIPAVFEIGFPIPEKRSAEKMSDVAGYHCWAKFHAQDNGWIPVDISEASNNPKMKDYYFGNLTADRIAFSTGRDLTLAPAQDGGPLNYFVYPYVEVGGKEYPAAKVTRKFAYQDVTK
jgi:transglutaminase-like putative cysteine protease